MLVVLGFLALALLAAGGYTGGRVASALLNRFLDQSDRKLTLLEKAAKGIVQPAGIPPDLYRRITKWHTQDAQEAERKILLDLYFEFQHAPDPWAEVRGHLPQEPTDTWSDDISVGGLMS